MMKEPANNRVRRGMLAGLAGSGAALAGIGGASNVAARSCASLTGSTDWLNAKSDFNAKGDGTTDDTQALQSAIDAGSRSVRPIVFPTGVYRITQPLNCPPNTMLLGSSPGLGFGCRIEPLGCAAFNIGGKTPSFQCSIEDLMIWPKGPAPDYVISVDNSYSVTFRNIRIHECQDRLRRSAVLLLGDRSAGGHGQSNNIIWDNLIVRNDVSQPAVAVLAAKGCGSHRFLSPDLENYGVLFEWQGGQIDLVTPYTERAGRYAVNCNIDSDDAAAYLNTFGGTIDAANSGVGCAIRSSTRNFNSFGTIWGATADRAAYVYSVPNHPVHFHGIVPNVGDNGKSKFSGVAGWRRAVRFPQQDFTASQSIQLEMPPHGRAEAHMTVRGVAAGEFWARVAMNDDPRGAQLSAFVSALDTVTIVAQNTVNSPVKLTGMFFVSCGIA